MSDPTTDPLDELAAFGDPADATASTGALTDLVARNPVPAVLAAAAAGAGLMALVSLLARRDPAPRAPLPTLTPTVTPRGLDYEALKQQIADLADRVSRTVPVDAAKQRAEQAGDVLADGWNTVRDQALDALGRFEPQASAAIKAARANPVWSALIVGAVGALVASQMLGGKPPASTEPQSDPSADA
ncbi:MAG: hypothetical protein V4569_10895 [Pseudomonadota bacterium]